MGVPLVIHGHFYQPPRENPWTELVEPQPSAHPFHDWNERIHQECYRANAVARIRDPQGRIERIVDNYRRLSFNLGPTLLSWMEQRHPRSYQRILDADRRSVFEHRGHGNAIAQGYNHAILPLCSPRDRRTQIRWGIADFRHRFGRAPESLWLPETACDPATLGDLIDAGMRYVILSPRQAKRVRARGSEEWTEVSGDRVDSGRAYRYPHPDGSGRFLSVFFYDGALAHSIAFEGGLASSQNLIGLFHRAAGRTEGLVHVATDGESYGHHTKFGDLALAYALDVQAGREGFELTNYGEHLARYPAADEVELESGEDGSGSSWSCVHGLGRWSRDCGCVTQPGRGWNQAWRAPLRAALDDLRDFAAARFEEDGGTVLRDPWAARDDYIEVLLSGPGSWRAFLVRHGRRGASRADRTRALTLLEVQRQALLMYTSCGWFFDDVGGIEAVQILKYSCRVLDLLGELQVPSPRERFLEILGEARSNETERGTAADIFRDVVEPLRVPPRRMVAHLALSGLVDTWEKPQESGSYLVRRQSSRKETEGGTTLATGRVSIESVRTGRRHESVYGALHLGGAEFSCFVRSFEGEAALRMSTRLVWDSFRRVATGPLLETARREFGPERYGLADLLPGGRAKMSEIVFADLVQRFSEQYARLYEDNRSLLEMLQSSGFSLPPELRAAAEFTLGHRFEEEIRRRPQRQSLAAYRTAVKIAKEAAARDYQIDRSASIEIFSEMITDAVETALREDREEEIVAAVSLIHMTRNLGIEPTLERAQEALYEAAIRMPSPGRYRKLGAALQLAPVLFRGRVPAPRAPEFSGPELVAPGPPGPFGSAPSGVTSSGSEVSGPEAPVSAVPDSDVPGCGPAGTPPQAPPSSLPRRPRGPDRR
jgi:alpha-amylase/alpha-mannosidase (GH57 family)